LEVDVMAAYVVRCATGCLAFGLILAMTPPAVADCTPTEAAILAPSDGGQYDNFGYSVAMDGDRAVVGARQRPYPSYPGGVYVYGWTGTTWNEQAILTASDAVAGEMFGSSVAIDGDRIVVGAPRKNSQQGAVYVFAWDGGAWVEEAILAASDATNSAYLGNAVAIDGTTILAGASGADNGSGPDTGAVYVFEYDGMNWSESQKLVPADGAHLDKFGASLWLDGAQAIVGAPEHDASGTDAGAAYILSTDGMSWSIDTKLVADDGSAGDRFGESVALDGDRAIVSAPYSDADSLDSGAVYTFVWFPEYWHEFPALTAADTSASDHFGESLALEHHKLVVGAILADHSGSASGAAYLFEFDYESPTVWTEQAVLLASDGSSDDYFGAAVAIDDGRALVGAYMAGLAGQAYVFELGCEYVESANWINPAGGVFSTGSNWSGGQMPGATEQAVFDLPYPHAYTTTFDADEETWQLLVAQGAVTFDLGGNTYTLLDDADSPVRVVAGGGLTLTNGNLSAADAPSLINDGACTVDGATASVQGLIVGRDNIGWLNFYNAGSLSSEDAVFGEQATGWGGLAMTGTGNNWTLTGGLTVGKQGSAEIVVFGYSTVSSAWGKLGEDSGSGIATITGGSWTNGASLEVGIAGSGQLTVNSGGSVGNTTATLASQLGSTGNVTIDGAGSVWASTGAVTVGERGDGTLNVRNGGQVQLSGGNMEIGIHAGATGSARVDGAGSSIDGLTNLYIGGQSTEGATGTGTLTIGYQASVTPSGWLYVGRRGTGTMNLETASNASCAVGHIGDLAGSTGTVDCTGSTTTWQLSDHLIVGYQGDGTLTLGNGAALDTVWVSIGHLAGSTGATTVSGSNSALTATGTLHVGESGTGSLLIDHGQVSNTYTDIGRWTGGVGDVTVRGSWAQWTLSDHLMVGYQGEGTLTMTDGASIDTGYVSIGGAAGGVGDVTVSGAETSCTATGQLFVGETGTGSLAVESGATISNTYTDIGRWVDGVGDVSITGPDSNWTLTDHLTVGYQGYGTLAIADGAQVTVPWASIGNLATGTGEVTVDGTNSTWVFSQWLAVGEQGNGILDVLDGGRLQFAGSDVGIGVNAGATGAVTVSGSGSAIDGPSNMFVGGRWWPGGEGTGSLTISDSAEIRIDDSDPAFGAFIVGEGGNGTVLIESDGHLSNYWSVIGRREDATGSVTVTGAGSNWEMVGGMSIPEQGQGTLVISEGASVSGTVCTIGDQPASVGEVNVTSTGPRSTWSLSDWLTIGNMGAGTLSVSGDSQVNCKYSYVGANSSSIGHVSVTGPQAVWTLVEGLSVANHGKGRWTSPRVDSFNFPAGRPRSGRTRAPSAA
jgi:T5SS/PEP-CTERM-associated repeat protein